MKSPRNRDHPRVGGEKLARLYSSVPVPGSPPRGQGKGRRIVPNVEGLRITPAWAGKSLFCFTAAVPIQDHPRVGREKQTGTVYAVLPYGSPPRMRGKEQGAGGRMAAHGITPAWAGKSRTRHRPGHRCRDHPRVGGEKFYELEQTAGVTGSPPRGRGKVWLFRCDAL